MPARRSGLCRRACCCVLPTISITRSIMRRLLLIALGAVALTAGCRVFSPPAMAQVPSGPRPEMDMLRLLTDPDIRPRMQDFNTVVKGAKEYDGLFKLYQKDDRLYMEIMPQQFDKPILCPIAVARGAGIGGFTLNFDDQAVLILKLVGGQ